MMKTGRFTIGFLLALALFFSCKEVYYPDEIFADRNIPVILGHIMEGEAPEVQLSWAFAFDQGQTTAFMHGAEVWITDDAGGSESLEEANNGVYVPVNASFEGVMGRTYTLHVVTPEGDLYESTPEQILPVSSLDSLYAEYVDRVRYVRTASGNLFPRPAEGLDVFVSLNRISDSTCYFRFRTQVLEQIRYAVLEEDEENPDTLIADTTYAWESYSIGEFYDVRFTHRDQTRQVVPEQNVGYMDYIYDPWLATETQAAPLTYAWVVSVHVVSISSNIYHYYNSVAEQLEAGDRIFATVPSQIKTNLHPVSNIEDPVLGVFEATSEAVFHKAFHWLGDGLFLSMDLEDFPQDLGSGSVLTEPPDFWIEF
jgi:hypothetical protein